MLGGVVEGLSSNPTVGHKNIFQHLPAQLIYYFSPYQSSKSNPAFVIRLPENSHCQASSQWEPLLNQERIRQGKERDGMGSIFQQLFQRYSGPLSPTGPTASRL